MEGGREGGREGGEMVGGREERREGGRGESEEERDVTTAQGTVGIVDTDMHTLT